MPDAAPTTTPWTGVRVVLVHDWLTGMRGGEKVLESICRIFPGADLLTLVHVPGSVSPLIEQRRVRTSVIQRLPAAGRWYRHYLPLFPAAIEGFDLDDVDFVVSTSHCAAKSVVPTGRARHLCYCHSPMRYAWDQFDHYFGPARVGRMASAMLRPVMASLARWDRATASRVTRFVANSNYVAGRIARYYNREASVLHPPVDTAFFTPVAADPEPYFLVVSALVPYKRIDVAVDAAAQAGVPLRVVGAGPDLARLRGRATASVQFLGALDNEALRAQYRGARALVLPAVEDFGIAPVEAMACGRPVIALAEGGATETVVPDVTGWLVPEQSPDAFAQAMRTAATQRLDPGAIVAHAAGFSTPRFEARFRALAAETLTTSFAC